MMTGTSYRIILEIAERYAKLAQEKSAITSSQQTVNLQQSSISAPKPSATNTLENEIQLFKF